MFHFPTGLSSACGIVARRGIKAENDGDAVARIKQTGAIPLLVSNTSEMCLGFLCDNNITGTTCNPYDLTRNTGASSGGEVSNTYKLLVCVIEIMKRLTFGFFSDIFQLLFNQYHPPLKSSCLLFFIKKIIFEC